MKPFYIQHNYWWLIRETTQRLHQNVVETFSETPIHEHLKKIETTVIFKAKNNIRSKFSPRVKMDFKAMKNA